MTEILPSQAVPCSLSRPDTVTDLMHELADGLQATSCFIESASQRLADAETVSALDRELLLQAVGQLQRVLQAYCELRTCLNRDIRHGGPPETWS